jgi:hypothetical protein
MVKIHPSRSISGQIYDEWIDNNRKLINEQSLSDAEMTAAGFKSLNLGKIIGAETYRWIIFTSAMGLVDGSSHRMPGWGCY